MRVALFFPESPTAAWGCTYGIGDTLKRMNHEVVMVPMLTGSSENHTLGQLARWRRGVPEPEDLNKCDLVLLSGLEHFAPPLGGAMEPLREMWGKVKPPKAAWYHESFERDDKTFYFKDYAGWADHHFFPAIQDAERHDQECFAKGRSHFLPFGVDTAIFKPTEQDWGGDKRPAKKYNQAFIGMVYGKREDYLRKLTPHMKEVELLCGQVFRQDLDGYDYRGSAHMLAESYRAIRVFANLPAYSRLQVTKIFEILACGTFLLTPAPEKGGIRNADLFEHKKHLVYYAPTNLPRFHQYMRDYLDNEEEREKIATEGCREVHAKHRLDQRVDEIFRKVGIGQEVAGSVTREEYIEQRPRHEESVEASKD